jgi:NIMA (never in mitosis gene a)-related kinase
MEQHDLKVPLGFGSFGMVTEVSHKLTKEKCCMKQIDLTKADLTYEEAKKKIELYMKLNHPSIVKVFNYSFKGNFLFIVMELVEEGSTLNKKIKEHSFKNIPFEETFIFDIFIQLASALYECKKQNILHLNLNPKNILITKEGQVKLTDFGISCLLDSTHQQTSAFIGPTKYIAPEVTNDQPCSFPADVWSLGCVIYQLMALKHPVTGSKLDEIINYINKRNFSPLPENYDQELKQTVEKMLALDVKNRITIEAICQFLFLQLVNHLKTPQKQYSSLELFRFGVNIEKGYLGSKDLKKAMKYYKMSSDLGNSDGMNNYGIGFDEGYLGNKD